MTAVVVLDVDGLCPVDAHTGVVGSIGKQISPCTNAQSPLAGLYELPQTFYVFFPKIQILGGASSAGNYHGIQFLQNPSGDIACSYGAHAHIRVETYRSHRLPNAGLRPAMPIKHAK
jgi:hypothetical protein